MKLKYLFLLAILFINIHSVSAEKLPNCLTKYEYGGPDTYIVYRTYFNEYFNRLDDAFKPRGKFPWRSYNGTTVEFSIHKDGTISDFKIEDSSTEDYIWFTSKFNPIKRYRVKKAGPEMDKYVTDIIFNNPPKPFPDGIEYDEIIMNVQMGYLSKSADTRFSHIIDMCGVQRLNYKTNKYTPPRFCVHIYHDSRKIK